MRFSSSTRSRNSAGSSRCLARCGTVLATVANESARVIPPDSSRTLCTSSSDSSTPASSQPRSSGQRTTTSTPIAPPNSRSTRVSVWEATASRGRLSITRLSASSPVARKASRSVAAQPTAEIDRGCRTENAVSALARRPASRDDRPSRMPLKAEVEASRGVSSVTARKLATAPAAAASPKMRTASMRAAASEANPIAVTRLVRPHAAPTRRMAPLDAATPATPRRALRRMSSMKWIESHVPTTSASEGTTLVRRLTGTPQRPTIPIAHTAPTKGGTQATMVDRRLRATAAESTTARPRPSELKKSMSRRSASAACSRRAGMPVRASFSTPLPRSALWSARRFSMRVTTSPSRGGLSAAASRRAMIKTEEPSLESKWP